MFSVLFEVDPRSDRWDDYLNYAKMLRPELENVDGFVDNIRYRSLNRDGWILSLSNWRDEKALVRWRTTANHHEVQMKGRTEVLADYHLRVGQLTSDTTPPAGMALTEQRLDETGVGAGTTVTLLTAHSDHDWIAGRTPDEVASWLGLPAPTHDLVGWELFEAVLEPGALVLMLTWRDAGAAREYIEHAATPENSRLRTIRVIRDYGMRDRREAPQYYPPAQPGKVPAPIGS
ncbi:MAG: hypothetical protein QOG76_4927 [Pseudonocardiales bacterium]|nr:hypothetical protein [Pseudonocardiales bacterium]